MEDIMNTPLDPETLKPVIEEPKAEEPKAEEPKEEPKAEEKVEVKEEPKSDYQSGVDKKIGTWRKKMGDMERTIEHLKGKLDKQREIKKPNEEDFNNPELYQQQKQEYDNQQEERRKQEIIEDYKVNEKYQEQQHELQENRASYNRGREEADGRYKDYYESEGYMNHLIGEKGNPQLFDIIMESKDSHAIVDYFGQNKEEGFKFVNLTERGAVRKIAQLEADLGKKPKKNDPLPEPLPKAGGGALDTSKNISDMTQKEYNIYMKNK